MSWTARLLIVLALPCGCKDKPTSTLDRRAVRADARTAADPTTKVSTSASLRFVGPGGERILSGGALTQAAQPREVSIADPHYGKRKRFVVVPLLPLLEAGLRRSAEQLARLDFVLEATDGYRVAVAGRKLVEPGAALALADRDHSGWEPIGPQRAHPGPLYLIWTRAGQRDTHAYPWPWALASIRVVQGDAIYAHTEPRGLAEQDRAWRGQRLFARDCISCHAINREGGRLGPDLNVPQSIVEYRSIAQIRQYIRNPLFFRYGRMPPQPQLGERDLDDLIAYFQAMKRRKHDPDAAAAVGDRE